MSDRSPDTSIILDQMKRIQQISYKLLEVDKPELILGEILKLNADILSADAGTIVLWESDLGFFNTTYNIDSAIQLKGMMIIPDQGGLDGRIYRERDRKYIELSNYSKNMDAFPHLKPLGFSYALGVPLYFQENKLIGTMVFYYKNRKAKYQESESYILQELAQQTCVAILNARMYQDLEESKQNEEHARNFLDLLVNSSPDIILNTDLAGKIKFWNSSAEKVLKFSASEIMNKKLPLILGENEENFYDLFSQVRNGKTILDRMFYFYTKGSKNKRSANSAPKIILSLVPIKNHRDSIDSILITGKDVSEKEKLKTIVNEISKEVNQKQIALTQKEQLLEQTQQNLIIAEKLATIGLVSDKLNHQINNPLMGILSSLSIVKEDIQEFIFDCNKNEDIFNSPFIQKHIENIVNTTEFLGEISLEGERIKNVLKELRYFSEVTKEKHFRKNQDLIDILNQIIVEFTPILKENNIRFSIDKNITRAKIYGNFSQIKKVIIEIIENAIIAIKLNEVSKNKGELQISLSKFQVNQKPNFRLNISDNGIGINEEQMQHLFEPFYTEWMINDDLPENMTTQHVGLSLATVKMILQHHNAHITVKNIKNDDHSSNDLITQIIIDFPEI